MESLEPSDLISTEHISDLKSDSTLDSVLDQNPDLEALAQSLFPDLKQKIQALDSPLASAPTLDSILAQDPDLALDLSLIPDLEQAIQALDAPLVPSPPKATNLLPIGINKKYMNQVVVGYQYCKDIEKVRTPTANPPDLDMIMNFRKLEEFSGSFAPDASPIRIVRENCRLDLYKNGLIPNEDEQYLFIFSGRSLEAYLPEPSLGITPILVMTPEEFERARTSHLPAHCQVLVINHIAVGELSYQMNFISARRLAAFVCARALEIPTLWIADDNIQSIHFKSDSGGLKQLSQNLVAANLLSSGISTYKPHHKKFMAKAGERRMGDKLLCVNMRAIIALLGERGMHELVFPPSLETGMGTDLFFQSYLEQLSPGYGFSIFPENQVLLKRSQNQKNLHLQNTFHATSKPALQTTVDFDLRTLSDQTYSPTYFITLDQLISELKKRIIEANTILHNYQNKDLYHEHFIANRAALPETAADLSLLLPSAESGAKSIAGWHAYIQELMRTPEKRAKLDEIFHLRDYQIAAIEAVAQHDLQQKSQVIIGTGGGKTLVELVLMVLARLYYGPRGPSVILIENSRQLVEQVYLSLMRFTPMLHSEACNMKHILKIMSGAASLSAQALKVNQSYKTGGFLLYCDESFTPEFESPLVLLDEAHLGNQISQKAAHIFFTATPRELSIPSIFNHSRVKLMQAGYIPPLALKCFPEAYSDEDAKRYQQNIGQILRDTRMPMGQTMAEQSGIIYVKSIQDTKTLEAILQAQGFAAQAIHSHLTPNKIKTAIDDFHQHAGSAPKILIAAEMLGVGFDSPFVNWMILLRPSSNAHLITQQLGRLCRKLPDTPKVGFALVFADINLSLLELPKPERGFDGLHCDSEAYEFLDDKFREQNYSNLSSPVTATGSSSCPIPSPGESSSVSMSPATFFTASSAPAFEIASNTAEKPLIQATATASSLSLISPSASSSASQSSAAFFAAAAPSPILTLKNLIDARKDLGQLARLTLQLSDQLFDWHQEHNSAKDFSPLSYHCLMFWTLDFAAQHASLGEKHRTRLYETKDFLSRHGHPISSCDSIDQLISSINAKLIDQNAKNRRLPDFLSEDSYLDAYKKRKGDEAKTPLAKKHCA